MSKTSAPASLISWTLSFMRPYRGRMMLAAVLLLLEVALGALQPWLLKVVIDYVLVGRPIPQPVAGRFSWYDFQEMPAALSIETRCCVVVDWLLELGSPSPVNV